MHWSKTETGPYARIKGMDPRADWLLGPGAQEFLPACDGVGRLIPFIMRLDDPAAVAFVNGLLFPAPTAGRGPPFFVPSLYIEHGAGPSVGRCFTGLAPEAFFRALAHEERYRPLRDAEKRVHLGLPVPATCLPHWTPGTPLPAPKKAPVHPPKRGWKAGTVVIGVIDDGIAFAHERFRAADGTTRVQCFWHQDGQPDPDARTVDYGRELWKHDFAPDKPGIDALLRDCRQAGLVDEDEIYRCTGLIDFARPDHRPLAWRAAHGTHVLDLAAGEDPRRPRPDRTRGERPIVCVQLPVAATADTSGAGLESHVQDGIKYILRRAADLAGDGPPLPVVINFSYGTNAGPHDGTSALETFLDEAAADRGAPVRIVLPAGNGHLSRCHAQVAFPGGGKEARDGPASPVTLHWRVLPDDMTRSILEIWLPCGGAGATATGRVGLSLSTPHGDDSELLHEGEGASLRASVDDQVICEACYHFVPAPTERGLFRVVLQPTARLLPTSPPGLARKVSPPGVWKVRLHNLSLGPDDEVHAWIERDDAAYGYPVRGRQSHFEQPDDARFDAQGREVEDEADAGQRPCGVVRAGMVNAIATGERVVVAGGYSGKELRPASYSAGGPIPPARDGAATGDHRKPDALFVTESSKVHTGVIAAGARSGSAVVLRGTSAAAPQLARLIADELAQGRPGDRAAIERIARRSEARLPARAPALPAERGGWGRVESARADIDRRLIRGDRARPA